jgi:SAM-dependent methyltransferase
MELRGQKQVWEDWARADPLWAILSVPDKTHGRWDREEFFATGRTEIRQLMAEVEQRGIDPRRDRCLDFGCGVGRLTQALAEYFERCDGIDISDTMVRQAREFNRFSTRCVYHVNDAPNLELFPDKSFDFIYSYIVLQHIEPDISENYVREFIRLLSDGGIAIFQVPSAYVEPENRKLPDQSHLATVTLDAGLPSLIAGQRIEVRAKVRNDSKLPWSAAPSVNLGNHWRSSDGATVLVLNDGRTCLPRDLAPGEEISIDLVVNSPNAAGAYVLELDMVEEGVCWFADRGSPTLSVPVRVSAPSQSLSSLGAPLPKPTAAVFRPLSGFRKRAAALRKPTDSTTPRPRPYAMHALPRERVMAAVEECGGRFLDIQEFNPSGEGWESYRYFVTR